MNIHEFVDALNTKVAGTNYQFSLDKPGPKFTRVVCTSWGSRSVHCFIDHDGNIYKAAGWKAPAKGIRGTLDTIDIAKVDKHGGWLYR